MNDVTPPKGGLPRPSNKPNVSTRGMQSAPQPVQPAPKPAAPVSSLPLDLPAPSGLTPSRPKRRWVKWVAGILVVIILAAAAAVFAAYSWYQDALRAKSDSSESVKVVVETGETADAIATRLEKEGIIKSALATQIFVKLNGKGNIKAGSYLFSPNQLPAEIFQWLNDGRVDTFKVTVLPGQTLAEIKAALIKSHYSAKEIEEAFTATYDHPLLADKPASASLEGYIYPETYFVTSDTSVKQLLVVTFDEFQKQIDEKNIREGLKAQNFNFFQGMTLASIIEKEVSGDADQRQVAQVFELRLKTGMVLGSDVTYKYGAKLLGVEPTAELDSPYNTRKVPGLPPGPISNFNISALIAVTKPADGDYLYFVSGDDGTNHFSRTFEEHEANINQYCKQLCSTY